jgi:hypothetical protein
MKIIRSWITITFCLSGLVLISSACQSNPPAVATPAETAIIETQTSEPTAEVYPQPYPPLPTFDPYMAPAVPDPYAYPDQGAPLAPGDAGVLYPGVQDGTEVYWVQAVSMILNGEVTQVMQTHDLKVYLTLKDGRTLFSLEPEIDTVIQVIRSCGDPCKAIMIATE